MTNLLFCICCVFLGGGKKNKLKTAFTAHLVFTCINRVDIVAEGGGGGGCFDGGRGSV